MKSAFVLYYVFLFIGATFASFASATDLKLESPDKEDSTKLSNKISRIVQTEALFNVVETKSRTSPNNITRYIVSKNGKKNMQLPSKLIPPLYHTLYNNRIIFSGHSQSGTITMVIDSKNFQIIDIILHFPLADKYSILQSPSGRYLLFRKFSPRNAPCNIASDFIMVYDLDKTPKGNRICGDFSNTLELSIKNSEVGNFFYPENRDLVYSAEAPYSTQVDSKEKQIFMFSTGWDIKNNIAVISEKSRSNENKFIIVSESPKGLTKKIYDLKDAKLYTKNNVKVKYHQDMNFFMERFEVIDGVLCIHNGAENPSFQTARLKIDI